MFLNKRRILDKKISRKMEKRSEMVAKKQQKRLRAIPIVVPKETKAKKVEVVVETTTTTTPKPKKIKKDNE